MGVNEYTDAAGVRYVAAPETDTCVGCAHNHHGIGASPGCMAAPDCTADSIIWIAQPKEPKQ